MIVFLTKDLMMSSNASSHARQNGVELKTVDSAERITSLIEEHLPHVLLIDLQSPGLVVERLGELIHGLADSVRPLTIAYAQHVNVELLERAKSAGIDQVLTRGQLNSQMGQIVADAG
jgi:CheY-like chemotaxis protein